MGGMALTPSWLYDLFGVVMLAIAAYSLSLVALGVGSGRTSGWDVEVSHGVTGIAMAGMFVGGWAFGPSGLWEALFVALLVWFVIRAGRSVLTYGLHLPHTAVHALMSFAMLLMYWFSMASRSSTMSTTTKRADPGLLLIVAVLLLASAISTLASGRRGEAVYGAHAHLRSASVTSTLAVAGVQPDSYLAGTASAAPGVEGAVSRPWLLDATHVAMCVAMGFMLVLML